MFTDGDNKNTQGFKVVNLRAQGKADKWWFFACSGMSGVGIRAFVSTMATWSSNGWRFGLDFKFRLSALALRSTVTANELILDDRTKLP